MIAAADYLVQFGRSGGLGCFNTAEPLPLRRGDRVLVETFRGQEIGTVVRAANANQARMLGAAPAGTIQRRMTRDDESRLQSLQEQGRSIFEACLSHGQILDVEMLFANERVIVHYAGPEPDLSAIEGRFGITVYLESVNPPVIESKGCGKPDCGREDGASSCSSCGTGGGCSSCGSGQAADLRPYFAHLRSEMETQGRVPLI